MTQMHDNDTPKLPPLVEGEPLVMQVGEIAPPEKHWYQSKTIWFNLLVIVFGVIAEITPALEQHMSADVYAVLATFVSFINAVMRLSTAQAIKKASS